MTSLRSLVSLLCILTALTGCGTESAATQGPESAKNSSPSPSPAQAASPKLAPDFLVFSALSEDIGLTAQQRGTIQGIVDQGRHQPPPPKREGVAPLAAAIRAGKVEPADVHAPDLTAEERNEFVESRARGLALLHKTLAKEQRLALIDATRARMAKSLAEQEAAQRSRPPVPVPLLDELELTPEQRKTIEANFAALEESPRELESRKARADAARKDMSAMMEAFKSDTFDPLALLRTQVVWTEDARKAAAAGLARHLQAIVSVLNPAQREKFAQRQERSTP